MVLFQALTWEARDEDGEHLISIFGRSEDSKSVCVTTSFKPYFYVKMSKNVSESIIRSRFQQIRTAVKGRLESYEVVKKKDLWGFQNNESFVFMKLNFATLEDMKNCDRKLSRPIGDDPCPLKVYESNLDPVLRLMHRTGIQSTGWIDTGTNCVRANISHVDIDLFCNDWKTLTPHKKNENAPFQSASFDIETNSSTGKFPDPQIEGDAVFQIALTLRRLGESECYHKVCLCYKKTAEIGSEGDIVWFPSERELLMGFNRFMREHDIDIMTGWNIFGFDLEYLYVRAGVTGCPEEFYKLGKLRGQVCKMNYKMLSSSALGDNKLKLLPMSGRFIFDLFQEVKREQKLDSYSLNFVSQTFLGDQKIDMSPKEMFRRFREEDPKELAEVAEYCIKDTILPHHLLDKLCTLLNLIEMAKATWVPICYLSERGQQIKVFSQLTRKARELGFMVPTIRWGKLQQDPYEGATVLDAHTGAYYVPITALDFEGLYPSIMMAHNLCYSSLVLDPHYGDVEGVKYENFKIGERTYRFAQDVPSLLPEILAELKAFRKQAKRDMAHAEGDLKKVFNGKQLAYKVSMNSVYGFTGAAKGMLPCVAIASTVTAEGRHMIEQTKEYVESNFPGAVVRYGDSVTPDTPLLVKINGVIMTRRIDSLCDIYEIRDDGKEVSKLTDIEVWTEKGFTPIEQIVRHKTSKRMFRVVTHTGTVDCTEDHSLLDSCATEIRPSEVTLGTKLLHGDCVHAFEQQVDMTRSSWCPNVHEAKVMGFFFGVGRCGYSNGKYHWSLVDQNVHFLEDIQCICPFETQLYGSLERGVDYKLSAIGDVKSISTEYRNIFYNQHNEKIVPSCILNAPLDIVNEFIAGYYMSGYGSTKLESKNKEAAMGLFILGRRLGYSISLNACNNNFTQVWSKTKQQREPTAIKKIEEIYIPANEYVYDLTTVSHHFAVGPGELVVHNTDSVMVEFDVKGRTGQEALEYSWQLGEQAAEQCNKMFKAPKNLELEKVYYPYILYSKKRYAAKMWTQGKDGKMKMDYIDVKGLQVVRRDNTPFVRNTCKELLDVILESRNSTGAKELAHRRAAELLGGTVPLKELVLSQKLADQYKNTNLPHVRVRDKMRDREPGCEPQSGDRVAYVLLDTGDKKAKAFEKAEDPTWAQTQNLALDYEYYFTNKFMNPVCDLLEPLVDDPKTAIFGDLIPKKPRAQRGQKKIDSYFKNTTE